MFPDVLYMHYTCITKPGNVHKIFILAENEKTRKINNEISSTVTCCKSRLLTLQPHSKSTSPYQNKSQHIGSFCGSSLVIYTLYSIIFFPHCLMVKSLQFSVASECLNVMVPSRVE